MKKLLTICLLALTTTAFANNDKTEFKNNATPGFLENKGQIADDKGNLRPDILFTTQSQGVKVFIGKQGLHYQFSKVDNPEALEAMQKQMEDPTMELPEIIQTVYRLDVELVGGNPNPTVLKEDATGYFENYYLAHCPDGITGVKSFEKVILKDVYQGIDWVFYRKGDYMKYDFIVHPGADASQIRLQFKGAENLALNEDGSFTVKTPLGAITEEAPISFTQKDQQKVESSFVLNDNVLSFNVTNTPNQTLVIDPTLIWATYYGGSNSEDGRSCATDANGSVYLTGHTASSTAIASGGHQNSFGGGSFDAFLVKFNSSGIRQWATYYGGTGGEFVFSCAIDNDNVYITGHTESTTAIASGGHQNTLGGGYDAFLVKFNGSGVRQWGTYFGGTAEDRGYSCATDANGSVYLTGYTASSTAIASGGHQNTYGGGTKDVFLVKFSDAGVQQWATYYGGLGDDRGYSCSIDVSGNIYLTGSTSSSTAITFLGHQNTFGGGANDAFLVKFNSAGIRQWATYYGGTGGGGEIGWSCSVDVGGNVYLAGFTQSSDVIASGGHQNTIGGSADAFLVKFDNNGIRQWGTYYGGAGADPGYYCSVDVGGNVYLTGYTTSSDGIASGGHQNTYGGGTSDAFLVKFNSNGARQWGTYYGGAGNDIAWSCANSIEGKVYMVGKTTSTDSISLGGHQNTYGGGTNDVFLAKFAGSLCTETTNTITPTACNTYTVPSGDETYTISGTYMDTIPNVGGCDSVLTINLTISNSTSGSENVTACDSYTWSANTTTYTTSGSYTATLVNSVGCDSTATLNLTITNSTSGSENVTVCDSYTWSANTTTYTTGGSYAATLTNSVGCDSTATLNLTINSSTSGSENVTACDSYTWSANTTTYTAGGSYTATLTNSVGCDSTTTLNLTINNSTSGSENITACDSYTWSANTTTYTTGGSYTATLTNSVGCDSTATLNLTINNSNSGTDVITACETHTWIDGNTYTTSNSSATHTLANVNGCDSVVTLNLTINSLPTVTVSSGILICTGNTTSLTASGASTYNWDNGAGSGASVSVSPTVTTTYTVTGTDANGCDNTASTIVTVDPCLGLDESSNELGVNIYPNPSTGEFTIEVKTNCQVEIVNAIGEIVFKQNLVSGANAVDISTNSNGLYFIKFKTSEHSYSKRVVLSK